MLGSLATVVAWGNYCIHSGTAMGMLIILHPMSPKTNKDPKGPNANLIRTPGFYEGNYFHGLGQVLLICGHGLLRSSRNSSGQKQQVSNDKI